MKFSNNLYLSLSNTFNNKDLINCLLTKHTGPKLLKNPFSTYITHSTMTTRIHNSIRICLQTYHTLLLFFSPFFFLDTFLLLICWILYKINLAFNWQHIHKPFTKVIFFRHFMILIVIINSFYFSIFFLL